MYAKASWKRLSVLVVLLAGLLLVVGTSSVVASHRAHAGVPLAQGGIPKTPNYVELTPRAQVGDVTLLDLTHSIRNGVPTFFGPFDGHVNGALWDPDGFYLNTLAMFENVGTQIDAPAHFVEGARPLHELAPDSLMGVAIKIDLRDVVRSSGDPNYAITAGDIQAWETATGIEIGEDHIVLVHTGWSEWWNSFVVGGNQKFIAGFPGLDPSAAEYLVSSGIKGWGIDTTSQDPAPSGDFPTHHIMGEADVWALENVDNLARIPTFSLLVVGPAKIMGPSGTASGGPARVWSLFDREDPQAFAESVDEQFQTLFATGRAFDLTQTIENGIPTFFGPYEGLNEPFGYEDGFLLTHLGTISEHTGTHLDAPAHFEVRHPYLDQLSLQSLRPNAVVVDASTFVGDGQITGAEIASWEGSQGTIEAGTAVLFSTGWGALWDDFVTGANTDYFDDFPGISSDAAELLVSRGVVGVGIDTLSIDPKTSTTFAAHHTLAEADIWVAENLADLAGMGILDRELFLNVLPWMIWHGSGGPVRIFAYDLSDSVDAVSASVPSPSSALSEGTAVVVMGIALPTLTIMWLWVRRLPAFRRWT